MASNLELFTRQQAEYQSQLEITLDSLQTVDIEFKAVNDSQNQEASATAAYVLPVYFSGFLWGRFNINNTTVDAQIGFEHKPSALRSNYYHVASNEELRLTQHNDSVLYIPLKLTKHKTTIGTNTLEGFTPKEGSPFSVLGIEDSEGVRLPLVLASETESGVRVFGLYKTKNGETSMYNHNSMAKQQLDAVRQAIRVTNKGPARTRTMRVAGTCTGDNNGAEGADADTPQDATIEWKSPKSIVGFLDQYVIGQEHAKKSIAIAFSNYMTMKEAQDETLPKDNLLLIGNSGTGKTYMISLLAERAGLPIAKSKLTGKSTEGYKGENLSTVFDQIREKTSDQSPYGIVFLDEIDKLASDTWGSGAGFGSRLQNELIGWMEDAVVQTDDKKKESIRTKNLLFVTAGAFSGSDAYASLSKIVQTRVGDMKCTAQELLYHVRPEDLVSYGLKPELVGRLPVISVLNPLTVDDKVRILTQAKESVLSGYRRLLQFKGYDTRLEDDFPVFVAEHAPSNTGARALHAVCNNIFTDILFEPEKYAGEDGAIILDAGLAKQIMSLYQENRIAQPSRIGF